MIRRQTRSHRVFDFLFAKIKSGEVKPGEKLPTEKRLTETLGVSRGAVREAMKSLQALQLITVRAAVGAVVNKPSPGAWFNAYLFAAAIQGEQRDTQIEFRKILEVGLVSLAAQKATDADLLKMTQCIREYEESIAEGRPKAQTRADVGFHSAIATASGNPIGEMIWKYLVQPVTERVFAATAVPNAALEGLRDHLRIFAAIKAHSPEKARRAMRSHLDNAERNFIIARSAAARPAAKRRTAKR